MIPGFPDNIKSFLLAGKWIVPVFLVLIVSAFSLHAESMGGGVEVPLEEGAPGWPWWLWSIILFLFTFVLGILGVASGAGGSLLFVPTVSTLFPFHLDFVRGAGLLIAMTGALFAGPGFLKRVPVDLRSAIPLALVSSSGAIIGALVGTGLSTSQLQILLGPVVFLIVVLMRMTGKSNLPSIDSLSILSNISDSHIVNSDPGQKHRSIRRLIPGLLFFLGIGFMEGMFGLGAGSVTVSVLHSVMGLSPSMSAATGAFILSVTDTTAFWIYLNSGAVVLMIVVPSVTGMMLGTHLGALVMGRSRPVFIQWFVMMFLGLAGLLSLGRGLAIL